ncbi:hypothetical protein [Amycolatopsis australiensis]|uniref:hypothetical protein n=1 Tax=Amycolatopsis australiensis TaxID=546364 RepID=UPI000931FFFF|nr:hypothetical protein [Amycolatopsis australiensis]
MLADADKAANATADAERVASEVGYGARRRPSAAEGSTSFQPGTRVTLADGSAKPIEQVRLGDRVLAADPGTVAEAVVATIVGHGSGNWWN